MAGIEVVDGVAAARGSEAARLVARDAVCATVDWPLPPDDAEEAIRPDVVMALSRALAACGHVAFRHDEPSKAFLPAPPRPLGKRLLDLTGLGDAPFGLSIATDAAGVAALFAYGGWNCAVQSALVFDPDIDPSPVLGALGGGLDWRHRALPSGVRLLFGPGHDGDFAVVAAVEPVWLAHFKTALR